MLKRVERIRNKLSDGISIVVGKLATLKIQVMRPVFVGTNKCDR